MRAYSINLDLATTERGELRWAAFASGAALFSVVAIGVQTPMDGLVIGAQTQAVPEPVSIASLGLGGLTLLRRRRKA
ncbi:PEP-CTERM sorting domain-containing protein [bacterium]|nr:MAG: PEP-CTERM sorting domain-containing protein [bacterium]